jgi:hypothetical protein
LRQIFYNSIILILVAYLIVGIFLSLNTGISHDEFHEQLNWEINYKSIKEFILTGSYNELLSYKDKYHGVGFNYLSQPFQNLISDSVSYYLNINEYGGILISKHVVVFILFFISGLFFYLICRILVKDKNFAIISLLFFYFYPYFFGHAQFNPKDIPFLSFWVINTYLIIKVIKNLFNEKRLKFTLIFILSLATSFLISIRIVGLLILLQYLIFFIVLIESKNINFFNLIKIQKKNIFLFFIFTLIFTYILNPILWHNPLEILSSLKWMSKYQQDICTLTLGNCMKSLNLPASYYFIWLFFKLPILVIIGFLFFPLIEEKLSENLLNKILIYSVLITITSILIVFIFLNVAIYDELRHIMFLIPLIFILAFHNIYLLNRKLFSFSFIFVIIFFTFENISLNPYQYTWLNSFSKFYKINKNFEVDYWGISGKKLYSLISNHSYQNNVNHNSCIYGGMYSDIFLRSKKFKCFKSYSELDSAKNRPYYVMKNIRNFKRSDPKNCKLIEMESYSYTLTKQKVNVGSAWFCD